MANLDLKAALASSDRASLRSSVEEAARFRILYFVANRAFLQNFPLSSNPYETDTLWNFAAEHEMSIELVLRSEADWATVSDDPITAAVRKLAEYMPSEHREERHRLAAIVVGEALILAAVPSVEVAGSTVTRRVRQDVIQERLGYTHEEGSRTGYPLSCSSEARHLFDSILEASQMTTPEAKPPPTPGLSF